MQPANRRRPASAPATGRIRGRHPRPASATVSLDAVHGGQLPSSCDRPRSPNVTLPHRRCRMLTRLRTPGDRLRSAVPAGMRRAGVTAPVSAPDPNRPYPESPVRRIAPNRSCMPRPAGRPDRIPAAGRDSRIIALSPCGIARRRLRGSRKRTLNRSSRRTACPASIAPQAVEPVGRHRGWRGSGGRAPGNAPGRTPGRRRPRLVGRGRRHEGDRP